MDRNTENTNTKKDNEKKNYTLVENNFEYANESYVQNKDSIFIFDKYGNYYIIDKNQEL